MQDGMELEAQEIHLWVCRDNLINEPQLLSLYETVLSVSELQRRDRFTFQQDRHQFLVTRAAVRHVLTLYSPSISPKMWRFCTNDYGKPRIAQQLEPALYFNVSHTSGLIVLAVARQDIGVDVEHVGRNGNLVDLAETFFAPIEWCDLRDLPKAERRSRFFELWTLKEAYVKARGAGFGLAFDSFSFRCDAPYASALAFDAAGEDKRRWRFWSGSLLDTYCLALAAQKDHQGAEHSVSIRAFVPSGEPAPINCLCRQQDLFGIPLVRGTFPTPCRSA